MSSTDFSTTEHEHGEASTIRASVATWLLEVLSEFEICNSLSLGESESVVHLLDMVSIGMKCYRLSHHTKWYCPHIAKSINFFYQRKEKKEFELKKAFGYPVFALVKLNVMCNTARACECTSISP